MLFISNNQKILCPILEEYLYFENENCRLKNLNIIKAYKILYKDIIINILQNEDTPREYYRVTDFKTPIHIVQKNIESYFKEYK